MYAPDRFRRRSGFFLTQEGEYDDAWKGFNNDIFHYSYLEHNETIWGMIIQNAPYSWTIITDTLHDKNVVYSKFTIHFIIYVLFAAQTAKRTGLSYTTQSHGLAGNGLN